MATLSKVKSLAEQMFDEFGATGECAFSVVLDGCNVTSVWMDRTGRFPLTDAEAIEEWGKPNISKYIREAINYLNVA